MNDTSMQMRVPLGLAVRRVIEAFDAQVCFCEGRDTCVVCADLAGAA